MNTLVKFAIPTLFLFINHSFSAEAEDLNKKIADKKSVVSAVENCKDINEKIEVYPAYDGMGGSFSPNHSGKPTVYCNYKDLTKKRRKLWKEEPPPDASLSSR